MANKTADDLTWRDIDVDGMTGQLAKLRDAHKAAAAHARTAREAYEAAIDKALRANNLVMDSHETIFSHRFGKLRYASKLRETSKPKSVKDAVSL